MDNLPFELLIAIFAHIPLTHVFRFRRLNSYISSCLQSRLFAAHAVALQIKKKPHRKWRLWVETIADSLHPLLFIDASVSSAFKHVYINSQLMGRFSLQWTSLLERYYNPFPSLILSIPSALGHLTSLRCLNLSDNCLSGTIPLEFRNLVHLETLDLHNNQLEGPINCLMELKNLNSLVLDHNRLCGVLPDSISTLHKLQHAILSHNCLEGSLPDSLFIIHTLQSLDLSFNSFSGQIQSKDALPQSLQTLNLCHNSLTGEIPATLFSPTVNHRIVWLNLSHNSLSGQIPQSLSALSHFLQGLDLSYNRLTGPIFPTVLSECTRLRWIRLNGNLLRGTVEGIEKLVWIRRLYLKGNRCKRWERVIPSGIERGSRCWLLLRENGYCEAREVEVQNGGPRRKSGKTRGRK